MAKNISFTIKFWRQNGPREKGYFDTHEMKDIPDDTSFLEMLDILNEELINEGREPFVFDHDCREGICGMCSLYINGTPHGKTERGATTCQLYMRRFNDGDVITVEPWRSAGFPVIKDCMVDRGAFDKIIQAGGYTSVRTGQAQDANAILIPKQDADEAMDCASCIGCGACVAACKNGSAMLFVSSKVSQLALLPQGRPEAAKRAKAMMAKMEDPLSPEYDKLMTRVIKLEAMSNADDKIKVQASDNALQRGLQSKLLELELEQKRRVALYELIGNTVLGIIGLSEHVGTWTHNRNTVRELMSFEESGHAVTSKSTRYIVKEPAYTMGKIK